jgi:Lysine-specific metallo-endopeptidase
MPFTCAVWMTMTKKWGFKRSQALRNVDNAFATYEATPTTKNLQDLSAAFQVWSNTKQQVVTIGLLPVIQYDSRRDKKKNTDGLGAVELLKNYIVSQANTNIVIKEQATGLTDRVEVNEISGSPFLPKEGRKIQESIRILAEAVRTTRDTTIAALRGAGAARTLYAKWFGAYNEARCREVRGRFQILDKICSQEAIVFTDGRDNPDATFADAFAYATPGNETVRPEMWLGRAFFIEVWGPNAGRQALSMTLGTIVHELSHACFDTDDIDLPASEGGALCNDPKNDCRLAEVRPDDAFVNADNYGEFVVDVYSKSLFPYAWP